MRIVLSAVLVMLLAGCGDSARTRAEIKARQDQAAAAAEEKTRQDIQVQWLIQQAEVKRQAAAEAERRHEVARQQALLNEITQIRLSLDSLNSRQYQNEIDRSMRKP